jgi:hypothetical protein
LQLCLQRSKEYQALYFLIQACSRLPKEGSLARTAHTASNL